MILSTPNDRALYTWTDPAHLLSGHRHYSVARLKEFHGIAGLRAEQVFTAGGACACVDNFFVMSTSFSKRVRRDFLIRMVRREYAAPRDRGYTVFMVSMKAGANLA